VEVPVVIGGDHGRIGAGPDPVLEERLALLVALILLVFGVFGVRLFQFQILRGEELKGIAQGNAVRLVRLEAPRGEVLDREGRVLATTRPAFGVEVVPSDLHRPELTFAALGLLLDVDGEALRQRVGQPRGRLRFQPVRLAGDLSFDQRSRVESHLYALPGVITDVRPRRHYVGGDLGAHLLGTLGEIRREQLATRDFADYRQGEVIGQSGIEALLEPSLRGKAGGRNVVVDVAGRVVGDPLDEAAAIPGGSVTLTIDLDLQQAAEEAFLPAAVGEPGKLGAAVALDPRTGDVLALVSKPSFDPNDFAGGVDADTWRRLTGDEWRPLQNRAISGQYPPGSAYKPFVAAAVLAARLASPQERVFCPGHFTLGRRTYKCWRKEGHGSVDLRDALKRSCDVYFYTMGLRLGIDRLAEYARGFGLGRRTGIPLAQEKAGLIPTSSWKERRFGERWMGGETVSASIGQGYNLVTPLQMAVAYAALANGGTLPAPRVVLARRDPEGRIVEEPAPEPPGRVAVAPEHLARIREALEAVVAEPGGTGGRARVPGVRVAGKTGTAQVVRLEHTEDLDEHEIPIRHRDHAWFVSFAPVDAPEIVVSVLAEHAGHGGSAAAPIAQKILTRYFEKRRAAAGEQLAAAGPDGDGSAGPAAVAPAEAGSAAALARAAAAQPARPRDAAVHESAVAPEAPDAGD
jgi:penicillin-binding protein 2